MRKRERIIYTLVLTALTIGFILYVAGYISLP